MSRRLWSASRLRGISRSAGRRREDEDEDRERRDDDADADLDEDGTAKDGEVGGDQWSRERREAYSMFSEKVGEGGRGVS